ncbi:hypothetical protein JY97_07780 [Alkalispirochaeta odontotermitis]|nr:hypothetical protein JY97_07780 [Alkalispirochaeta odontotermitis]CAB1079117.1 hypothetical protein D1AOALGA4SA_6833 [Olavius algarvensis Delta 1 endosymbiont]
MGKKKTASGNAIEGLVIPNKWDESGKIIEIAIHTNKEEVYLVAHNRLESELLKYLHARVGINGKIRERLDGNMVIHATSVRPIPDESNDIQEKQQCEPLLEE